MKIKIFKHKLKIGFDDDIAKFKKYFSDNGLNLELDIEETSVPKGSAVANLILPLDGKFDVVFYIYNRNDYTEKYLGNTYPLTTKLIRIFLGTDDIDDSVDYTWKSMCHEMMHALFFKYTQTSGEIPMDNMLVNGAWIPYYKNEEPYALDGNFSKAWSILNPIINPNIIRTVKLTRIVDDGVQTSGKLEIDNFACMTLERAWKNNQSNISCIPRGTYRVKYTFSPKFLKYTYQVMDVPNRTGIRIHSANYFFDLLGCIALGSGYSSLNSDREKDIINSRATIKSFEDFMQRKDFNLEII